MYNINYLFIPGRGKHFTGYVSPVGEANISFWVPKKLSSVEKVPLSSVKFTAKLFK